MSVKYQNKYRISTARASWWDYCNKGAYYITICTAHRVNYFGEITQEPQPKPQFNETGKMAHQFWMEIPLHFPFVTLDEFVIMPNHVHGIIVIDNYSELEPKSESEPISENNIMAEISPKTGSLSSVIRSFKSAVTKWCNENGYEFGWQSRFHDHIIRTDAELDRIREYILNNPAKWINDKLNINHH